MGGCIDWTVNDVNRSYSSKIICFDPRKNLFEVFPSPPSKFQDANDIIGLGVVGECLCMVRRSRQTSQVLIRKEYGIGESWMALTVMTLFFPPFLFIKNGENHEVLGNKNTSPSIGILIGLGGIPRKAGITWLNQFALLPANMVMSGRVHRVLIIGLVTFGN